MRCVWWNSPGLTLLCCVLGVLVLATACAPRVAEAPAAPLETPAATSTPEALAFVVLPTVPVSTTLPDPVPAPLQPERSGGSVMQIPLAMDYLVQPGDTLLGLALTYEVPMAAIQLHNGWGARTLVRAGEYLQIPASLGWEGASPFWVVHEVAGGETLGDIALAYQVALEDLRAANGLFATDFLSVDQLLVLPVEGPVELLAQASNPIPTPVPPAMPPDPTSTPEPAVEPPAPEPTLAPVDPPIVLAPPPNDVAAWAPEVFRLLNEQRALHGLPPFGYNETLAQAARLHGADCQQRGSCNHTGSDGSNVTARVIRAGYAAVGAAECIVYSTSPQAAVAWWMDEAPPYDPHRRTILSTWLVEVGIAVVPNAQGTYYFIVDFGRPTS
ncbi:MAG: LysM peptidoglycan-binding domain-containing protein [Anaerolineae bacterium]|nr:LysM peptidoglycan-binding domain-containing protein [Anaerolineae bacterium]